MKKAEQGFSLLELITVMILLGILSVTLFSRLGPVSTAAVQSGRDDIIAALFFAQQTAMMRSSGDNIIRLELTAHSVSVTENGQPIRVAADYYPLALPQGVNATPATFVFDKLGRTTASTITLTGSGNTAGTSAVIQVEASGYAYAN
jgi:MSHA pilin protein MshC